MEEFLERNARRVVMEGLKEKENLKKWFKKRCYLGETYKSSIDELISFHDGVKDRTGTPTEKELYETFVYMEEAEWFSFADDLKAMFEDKM